MNLYRNDEEIVSVRIDFWVTDVYSPRTGIFLPDPAMVISDSGF